MPVKQISQFRQEFGTKALQIEVNHTNDVATLWAEGDDMGTTVITLTYDEFAVLVADAFELSRIWREGRKA